jgi:tyrosine-specific transport protein
MKNINFKVLGCTLMLLGTCIGAGMLALPLAAAQYNYFTAFIFLLFSWFIMSLGAFALLEVNLWMSSGSNLFTMSKNTLGKYGNIFSNIIYFLLLYSLISAYISGCSDLFQGILASYAINLSHTLSTILVSILLISIVIFGIRIIDLTNRGLMFIKFVTLAIMLVLMLGHIDFSLTTTGEHVDYSMNSFMVMITAFGFAIIIPTIREYLEDNHHTLQVTLIIGCIIPLVVYSLWILAVHGIIPKSGTNGLIAIASSSNPNSDIITAISASIGYSVLTNISKVFITICAITSFLGVSLCLVDFVRDMVNSLCHKYNFEQELKNKLNIEVINSSFIRNIIVYVISFSVPLLVVLLHPGLFITALAYAGIWVLIFLVILPLLMLYIGRYHQNYVGRKFIPGGKLTLLVSICFSLILLIFAIFNLFL